MAKKGEREVVKYLEEYILCLNFSRSDGMPGDATDTNTLERGHLNIKGENYFNFAEGIGNILHRFPVIGKNLFANMMPISMVPEPNAEIWKRAQRLVAKGWDSLAYKVGSEYIVVPSEHMLKEHLPNTCVTVQEKRDHIKVAQGDESRPARSRRPCLSHPPSWLDRCWV